MRPLALEQGVSLQTAEPNKPAVHDKARFAWFISIHIVRIYRRRPSLQTLHPELERGIELIAHYRADSRVVHGQTTTRVTKENPVDGVIIVDDEISQDKFMLGVFANTLGSIRVLGFSVKKALEKLPEASASKKRYLVIFKTPETARELVEQGFEFDGVLNCGPQPNCDGAKLVEKMLYLTEPQIDALNYLDSRGVKLIINPAFTTPDLTWPEAKRKAGI